MGPSSAAHWLLALLYCSHCHRKAAPGREERVAAVQLTGLPLLPLSLLLLLFSSSSSSSCSLFSYSILTFLSLTGHVLGHPLYFFSTVSLSLSSTY